MKRKHKKKEDSLHLMVPAMEMSIKDSTVIRNLPPVSSRVTEIKKRISGIRYNANTSVTVLAGDIVAERNSTLAAHEVEWKDRRRYFDDEIAKNKEQRDMVSDRLNRAKEKRTVIVDKIEELEEHSKGTWSLTHRLKQTDDGPRLKRYYPVFWMIPVFIILVGLMYVSSDGSTLFITFDSTFQNIAAMGILMTFSAAIGLELLPTIAGYVKGLAEYEQLMSASGESTDPGSSPDDKNSAARTADLKRWSWSIWGTYALLLAGITVYRWVTMEELLQPASQRFFEEASTASGATDPKAIALVFLFLILNFMTSMVCYFLGKTFLYLKELETLREDEEKLDEEIRLCTAAYRELTPRIWELIRTKKVREDEQRNAEREQILSYYAVLANEYKNQIFKKLESAAQILIFARLFDHWLSENSGLYASEPKKFDVISNYIEKKEAS